MTQNPAPAEMPASWVEPFDALHEGIRSGRLSRPGALGPLRAFRRELMTVLQTHYPQSRWERWTGFRSSAP